MAVVVSAATEVELVGVIAVLVVAPTPGAAAIVAMTDAASASPIIRGCRAVVRGVGAAAAVAEDARWAPVVEPSKARASCLPDVALTTRRRWSMPPGRRMEGDRRQRRSMCAMREEPEERETRMLEEGRAEARCGPSRTGAAAS